LGQKDLGTCIIISEEDVFHLKIDLNNLQKRSDFHTPLKLISFSSIRVRKRLKKYIERKASQEEADIAIITHRRWNYSPECIGYDFSLYKYKQD
jgi:hypothetical protein